MRKGIILILLIATALPAMTQRTADYGASLGTVNYLGEYNPSNVLFKHGPAAQLFYRYNFNPRQAVRANLMGGYLSALGSPIGELGATYEFNFFPYSTFRSRRVDYTPYIAAGAAFTAVYKQVTLDGVTTNFHPFFSIPFSAGFKVNVANHIGLEFEYGFRKTFYDNFDGVKDKSRQEPNDKARLNNNDWYSFAGISFTWKIYNKLLGCPAFKDEDEPRRR